jgi:hypothetical protein
MAADVINFHLFRVIRRFKVTHPRAWDSITFAQFTDMAEGGGGDEHYGSTIRDRFYADWTNADFQTVINHVGGPNE